MTSCVAEPPPFFLGGGVMSSYFGSYEENKFFCFVAILGYFLKVTKILNYRVPYVNMLIQIHYRYRKLKKKLVNQLVELEPLRLKPKRAVPTPQHLFNCDLVSREL